MRFKHCHCFVVVFSPKNGGKNETFYFFFSSQLEDIIALSLEHKNTPVIAGACLAAGELKVIHLFLLSFVHFYTCYFVRLFVRSFVPLLLLSFVPSFFRSFILSFLHSFVLSFIRSFVHSLIISPVLSSLWSLQFSLAC